MLDYYKILGVAKNAPSEEIRRAYRHLAQQHHPDKGGDPKKFKEINEAYQVLINPQKRAHYDRFGTTFEQARQSGGFSGFDNFRDFDAYADAFDFFKNRSSSSGFDFGDIFGDFFGFSQPRQKPGQDIMVEIEISFQESFFGVKKELNLEREIICPECKGEGGQELRNCPSCQGRGQVRQTQNFGFFSFSQARICPSCQGGGKKPSRICSFCKGRGRIKSRKKIELKIPAGIADGQIISLSGYGNIGSSGVTAGPKATKAGNLYVRVRIKPHSEFKRSGDDLNLKKVINFTQAALGDKIEIAAPDKKIKLKIPAGIQSGSKIRITGRGMPHFQRSGRGDLIVEIEVATPKKLSKRAKQILEELGGELE